MTDITIERYDIYIPCFSPYGNPSCLQLTEHVLTEGGRMETRRTFRDGTPADRYHARARAFDTPEEATAHARAAQEKGVAL